MDTLLHNRYSIPKLDVDYTCQRCGNEVGGEWVIVLVFRYGNKNLFGALHGGCADDLAVKLLRGQGTNTKPR
jgi:hypothetical protein